MKSFDIVLISVNSPVICGIYFEKRLIASISIEGNVSAILPFIFGNIFSSVESEKFLANHNFTLDIYENGILDSKDIIDILRGISNINAIYYARGSGSLSAIKLTHIFLQTLSLTKKIPLFATNIFYFNNYCELKAFGNQSFFYKNGIITIEKSINPQNNIALPKILKQEDFTEPCTPLYVTTAV